MHACKLTPTQNMMTLSGYSPLLPLSLPLLVPRKLRRSQGMTVADGHVASFFTLQESYLVLRSRVIIHAFMRVTHRRKEKRECFSPAEAGPTSISHTFLSPLLSSGDWKYQYCSKQACYNTCTPAN